MLRRRARRGATRRRRRARRAPAAALRSGRTQRTSCGRACSSYPRGRLPRGSAFRRPRARSAGTLPRRARSRSCWRRAHVATITFKERGSLEFNERSMFSTDARGFFVAAIKLFSQLGFPMDAERIRGMMADAVNARLPVDGWRAQVPAEVPARQPERSRVRGCQVVSITVSVRSVTVSRRHVPLQKKDTRRALCQNTETLHGWIITNKSSRSDAWPSTGKRTEGTAPSSAGRLARRFLRHGHRRAGRVSASPSAPVARGEMSAHLSASYRCPVRCS